MIAEKAYVSQLLRNAELVASKAGDEWMRTAKARWGVYTEDGRLTGVMLDLCGNAHVKVRDRRTKFYKLLDRLGQVDPVTSVVAIDHKYAFRQEHGLKLACARVAQQYLELMGVKGLTIWSYID